LFVIYFAVYEVMYRIKSGLLAAFGLSIYSVLGTDCLEKRAFDVFDYVDPLIGTSSGGGPDSFSSAYSR
jgi:hypothetical protein